MIIIIIVIIIIFQCLAVADLGYLIVALVTSVFVGIPPNSEHSFIVSLHDEKLINHFLNPYCSPAMEQLFLCYLAWSLSGTAWSELQTSSSSSWPSTGNIQMSLKCQMSNGPLKEAFKQFLWIQNFCWGNFGFHELFIKKSIKNSFLLMLPQCLKYPMTPYLVFQIYKSTLQCFFSWKIVKQFFLSSGC